MGCNCAIGWQNVGLNIGTLLSISIGLVLGSVTENNISMGTRKNVHRRFNGKAAS